MPEIRFPCPGCKVSLKVSDTLAGKKIKCPKCAAIAPVPATAAPTAPPAVAVPMPTPVPMPRPVPMAQPVAPPPRKPAPPPLSADPEHSYGGNLEDQFHDQFENAPRPRKKTPPPKKKGMFVPILVFLLVAAYLGALATVYLGILLPMPEVLKTP